jgi:2-methylcitrate dehydratase PrpD
MSAESDDLATFIVASEPDEGVRDKVLRLAAAVVGTADRDGDSPAVRAVAATADPAIEGGVRSVVLDVVFPATDAAMLNGAALASGASTSAERITAAVMAAVLAHAELSAPASDAPIAALAVGVELGLRMAEAVGQPYLERGWDMTGIAGSIGAAAAVARLVGLAHSEVMQALGVAATQGAGLRAAEGSDTWSLHVGRAAANGLEASLLCAAGFSGPPSGIEGRRGFLAVAAPEGDATRLTAGLDEHWVLASGPGGAVVPSGLLEAFEGETDVVDRMCVVLRASV